MYVIWRQFALLSSEWSISSTASSKFFLQDAQQVAFNSLISFRVAVHFELNAIFSRISVATYTVDYDSAIH
jgi:hypothetical protein